MLRLTLLFVFIASSTAFLFPMAGGGGGGGGCGCGAPPPPPPPPSCCPPPSCGCAPPPPPPPPPPPMCGCGCGRKKRSVDESPIEGVINMDSDLECNDNELKSILEKNMKSTPSESLSSVRSSLPSDDFFVMCTHGLTVYSVPSGTKNCSVRKENHFCQVFSSNDSN